MIKFAKPSLRRVIWSLVTVTVALSLCVSIRWYIGALIQSPSDPHPMSGGDTVRLAFTFLTVYGPMLIITIWPVTVPLILAVGALIATIRVVDPPDDDEASAAPADTPGCAPQDDQP